MKTFNYTREQIEAELNNVLAEIKERRQWRMDAYYNCQDDYAFGGEGDRRDNERERMARIKADLLVEMLENGFITKQLSVSVLKNSQGEIVADRLVKTKFGQAWITVDNKFVSIPSKIATLNKKGYYPVTLVYEYKARFHGNISKRGEFIYEDIEKHLIGEEPYKYATDSANTSFIEWLYKQQK